MTDGHVEVLTVADETGPGLERYAHLALYAGEGNIICHSHCRADDPACTWDHRYTLGLDDDDWERRFLRVL